MDGTVYIINGYNDADNPLVQEIVRRNDQVRYIFTASYYNILWKNKELPEGVLGPKLSIDEIIMEAAQHRPLVFIPIVDEAVSLADFLTNHFKITPANDFKYSEARRNKYLMIERLHAAGIPAARQKMVGSTAEAMKFLHSQTLSWPMVAKPVDSAGCDNVFICNDLAAAEHAVNQIFTSPKMIYSHNAKNDNALLQEYLDGEEFTVDVAVRDGVLKVIYIAQYKLDYDEQGRVIKDRLAVISGQSQEAEKLISYARKVCDALGIRVGAGHLEIRLTPSGPKLVEVGARLAGGFPILAREATDIDPYAIVADAYLDPIGFAKRWPDTYTQTCFASTVYLRALRNGILDLSQLPQIKALPSFNDIIIKKKSGDKVVKTHDLFSILARVHLTSSDQEQIEKDAQAIRALEKRNAFVISEKS